MAEIAYLVVVPFPEMENGLVAQQGIRCPSERSAIAQVRGAVGKGAAGAIAFKRSGGPSSGEYGEAGLICTEGDLPDDVMEIAAASRRRSRLRRVGRRLHRDADIATAPVHHAARVGSA